MGLVPDGAGGAEPGPNYEPGMELRAKYVRLGEGAEQLAQAGVIGDLIPVRMDLRVTGSGATKPAEVIEALLGAREPAMRIVRTHLGLGALSPLSLDAVRTERRSMRDAAAVAEVAESAASSPPA